MKQRTSFEDNKCSYLDLRITNIKYSLMKTQSFGLTD